MQSAGEIEHFYEKPDPWGFETNSHDLRRRGMILAELNRLVIDWPTRSVLDIGCGEGFITGHIESYLNPKPERVVGTDISARAIERAQKNYPKCTFFADNLLNSLFADAHEPFDMVLITGLLYKQYFDNKEKRAWENITKVVRDGGLLIMSHIRDWLYMPIPYHFRLLSGFDYPYREFIQRFEVYHKENS